MKNCLDVKQPNGSYKTYCRNTTGTDCVKIKVGKSYVPFCRSGNLSDALAGVRSCVQSKKFPPTQRYPEGYTRCVEYTRDYKMVAPKEAECFLPGAAPTVTLTKTALSPDEKEIYERLAELGPIKFDNLLKQTDIPERRCALALIGLELKGAIAQSENGVFALHLAPIPKEQTGRLHAYSHPSGGEDIPAVYQLLEIDDIVPSHDARVNFRWSPGYPKQIQDRDYSNLNLPYQMKVFEKAAKLDPNRIISTAKTSVEGPPIVAGENNWVLSGNSRALAIIFASVKHPEKYRNYVTYLEDNAQTFGLSPTIVSQMTAPVLIRRIAIYPSQYKQFASLANESPAMALDLIGTLQAVAKYISDDLIMTMDIADDETLKAYIASSRGQRFTKLLMNALPATKVGAYVDRGMLTEEGKALIEGVLFFKLLPNMELIEHTPKQIRDTLTSSIPEFFRLKIGETSGSVLPGWDLTPVLSQAVAFYNRNLTDMSLSFWLKQTGFIEEEEVYEENTLWGQLVAFIDKYGKIPRRFRGHLRMYASQAEQILVPPPEGPVETLKKLVKMKTATKAHAGFVKPKRRPKQSGKFSYVLGGFDIFEIIKEGQATRLSAACLSRLPVPARQTGLDGRQVPAQAERRRR